MAFWVTIGVLVGGLAGAMAGSGAGMVILALVGALVGFLVARADRASRASAPREAVYGVREDSGESRRVARVDHEVGSHGPGLDSVAGLVLLAEQGQARG